MSAANITQSIPHQDDLEFPDFLRVESVTAPANQLAQKAFHPAADIFPLMEGKEFEALVADIKNRGLIHRIQLLGGKILDGRNRYRACLAAGVKPTYEHLPAVDPVTYVISANIHRRHLTTKQQRELIAKLLKATPEKSNRQIAESVKADHKTVGSVRTGMEGRGEIPHVAERKDTKGREQPSSKPRTGLLKWKIDGNEARADAPVDLDAFAIEGAIYTVMASKKLRKGQPKVFTVGLLTDVGHQSIGGTKRTLSAAQRFCEDHFRAWRRRAAIPHTESAADSAPPRDDIGPASTSEAERLRVRVEELQAQVRQRDFKIIGLESEMEELKRENAVLRQQLATASADPGPIPEFLVRKPAEARPAQPKRRP